MKKYARIENGMVMEIFETDGDMATMFHPSLVWVECDESVEQGDVYKKGTFSKPAKE